MASAGRRSISRAVSKAGARALWVLAASVAAVSVAAPAALSAVRYQIRTTPPQPIVGEPSTIEVATFAYGTGGNGSSPDPLPMAEFPWEFVADGPSGARHDVVLRPKPSGFEWSAAFTFDEAGEWQIGLHPRHLGSPADPSIGARVTVNVQGKGLPTHLVVILAAAALGLAIVAAAVSYRRATTRG